MVKKRLADVLFLSVILLLLLAGLVRTLFFPKELNTYENRYAQKAPALSVSGFLDGSYQSDLDAALADQVPLSQYAKKLYNLGTSALMESMVLPIAQSHPNRYINIFGLRLFNGTHLTYYTNILSDRIPGLDEKAENYNQVFAQHPDTEFYVYFIEKDTDIDFETGEKVGIYEYLAGQLNLPEERIARYRIDSFDQFSQWFYRTDHHWNAQGSYEGYLQVLELLGVAEQPLTHGDPVTVSQHFSGSKASSAPSLYEPFSVYPYDFPDMDIVINGAPAADYGNQDAWLSGQGTGAISYSAFYGGDMGEIIFDTGTQGRGSLLVIGESFDNAILKLLASHFDRLYSIDLRYYEAYMGTAFSLSDYLEEHQPDRVLLIGNADYFASQDFLLED